MKKWIVIIVLAYSKLAVSSIFPFEMDQNLKDENIRGITIAPIEDARLGNVGYGSEPYIQSLEDIIKIGTNWVSITPFGTMKDLEDTFIETHFEIPPQKSFNMLKKAALLAKMLGLKVAIIPHIYILSGQWRGKIDPGSKKNWNVWFDSYKNFILRFARLAKQVDADMFSIGVEFASSSNFYDDKWRKVIDEIKNTYNGHLTYSANWDEVQNVQFWDKLDYIGVNAFWPLARKSGDGFDVMVKACENIVREMEEISLAWNKKFLYTEFGVKSALDSALAPWEWPEHLKNKMVYNEEYQAMAYLAMLQTATKSYQFEGLFIWKYFSDPYDETQEEIFGFSPKNKQAEDILAHFYKRPWY